MRQQNEKIANAGRIRTIDFARSGIEGTGSLSPRSRRTLAVYIVLVKMGYTGISAPMGAIADAVFRSSHGEAGSIRTLQRANKELEESGFIFSSQFRTGKRARGVLIRFHLEAFSFWTRTKYYNVTPMPTQEYISPDATSCRPSDRTRNKVVSNSQDTTKNKHTEPRAGARANKKDSRRKNPVLFSVMMVLSKMAMHRTDRRAARSRAEIELKADDAGVELLNPSGVDWAYWEKRWVEFTIPVRESTVAREIIPRLLGLPKSAVELDEHPVELDEHPVEKTVSNPLTANEIKKVREELETKFSLPMSKETKPIQDPESYPEVDENDPEMQILVQARARARARVNGW